MQALSSLRVRAMAVLGFLFAVILGLATWQAMERRKDALDHALERLRASTALIAAEQTEVLHYARQYLAFLAESRAIDEWLADRKCNDILSGRLKREARLSNIAIVSADGYVICSAAKLATPVNISDRLYFRDALRANGPVVGESTIGRATGKSSLPVVAAARGADGQVRGLFLVVIDVGWLNKHMAGARYPPDARLGLIDAKGVVLARHPDPESNAGESRAETAFFRDLVQHGGRGEMESIGWDGVTRIYSLTTFAETSAGPITLWVGLSKESVLGKINREFAWTLSLSAALAALLGAAMWFGIRRFLLQPVAAISTAAQRLSEGQAAARTGLRGHDELGRLGQNFDAMAQSLASTHRLLHANRALRVLSTLNQALIHASDEEVLLRNMCRAIVEAGDFRMAWIGYAVDDSEKSVQPVGSWGADEAFLDGLKVSWSDNDRGRGPTGTAIRSGVPAVVHNVQTDPLYAPWREGAIRYGYGSSIALPLWIENRPLGALNIYAREPDAFSEEEVALLSEGAADLAFGIAAQRTRAEFSKARAALERSERYYRKLIEGGTDAFVVVDRTDKVFYQSESGERLTGHKQEEVLGQPFENLIAPESREAFARHIAGPAATGRMELKLLRKDGARVDVDVAGRNLTEDPDVGGVILTIHDISERKLAEQAIHEALTELRQAQHVARFGSWRLDCASNQVTWTDEIFRMFGMAPQAAPPPYTEHHRLFGAESFARLSAALRRTQEEGIPYELDLETVRIDGRSGWMLAKGEAVRDETGRIVAVRGTAMDITERKRAEAAVQGSEARFRALTENSSDLTVVLDAGGILRYVSPSVERIGGYVPAELVGRKLTEIVHPDDLRTMVVGIGKILGEPENPHAAELRYRHKDGRWIWLASVSKNALANPAIHGIVINARDVTEAKHAEQRLRDSETRYRSIFERAKDIIYIIGADGTLSALSPSFETVTGWKPEEWLGKSFEPMVHPDDLGCALEVFAHAMSGEAISPFEMRIARKSGGYWIGDFSVTSLELGGGRWIYGMVRDITGRRQAEDRIQRLNRVYAVLSGINSAIVRIRDRSELYSEACRIVGEAGRFPIAWIGVIDRDVGRLKLAAQHGANGQFLEGLAAALANDRWDSGVVACALRERRALVVNDLEHDERVLGREHPIATGCRAMVALPLVVSGEAAGVLVLYARPANFFDEDEMKLLDELAGDVAFALDYLSKAEKVNYLAYYDVLTGLPNRVLFLDRMQQYLRHAAAVGEGAALVLIDLQRFRNVNETLGRHVADHVLSELARRFASSVGEESTPARVGTDVFAFIAKNVPAAREAMAAARGALDACFAEPFLIEGNELRLAGRMGIALFPADATNAEGLFHKAEAALAKTKKNGTNALFYSPEMTARVAQNLALENQLRRAIAAMEFVLHYQPKYNARSGALTSVEALIRWQRPDGKLVSPGEFIPLLEETGLILPVGEWALQEAARQHEMWRNAGLPAPRIAVNVSALQLRSKDFIATLRSAIGQAPPAEHGIDLEITESLIMADVEDNIEKLSAAKALGMRVFVDDFGTGYSSLRYIAKLPIDALKIDRSFIIAMASSPEDMSIVSSIISLGRDLDLLIVGEGVDSEEQAKLLRLLKCDEMQGFLFSKPLPASDIAALLSGTRA